MTSPAPDTPAPPPGPTLGLCMIVRNEAHILRRCLEAARPLLDYLLIVDTGSADGTPDLVRDFLQDHDLPGQVLNDAWRDFASNRSYAVERLRQVAGVDYALMLDADDLLVLEPGFDAAAWKRALTADLYDVELRCGAVTYGRPQIWRNALPARFRGVLHEFLEAPGAASRDSVRGFHIRAVHDSARNRNPRKSADDARILAAAAESEAEPWLAARYRFYQAQCHQAAGELGEALAAFRQRAALGFWDQEVYICHLSCGRLLEQMGAPPEEALAAYSAARQVVPGRAEALHAALRCCRLNGRHAEGWALAREALAIGRPPTALFLEGATYDWALRDEYALAAYYAGEFARSLAVSEALLQSPLLPAEERPRVAANARFARERLPAPRPRPAPRPGDEALPGVFLAILARQAGDTLPLFLECLEALDYPTRRITLYIRTNDNLDDTGEQLRAWLARRGGDYAAVHYDDSPASLPVATMTRHQWTYQRLEVIRAVRQRSLDAALASDCRFYFTADTDNFVRPDTLRRLVALDVPLVAPLLRHVLPGHAYANFHAAVTEDGYYADSADYLGLLLARLPGLHAVPVVHCTYLLRRDAIPLLTYEDGSQRYDYVIFSDSARRAGVPQLLDNRVPYGVLTMEEPLDLSRRAMDAIIDQPLD